MARVGVAGVWWRVGGGGGGGEGEVVAVDGLEGGCMCASGCVGGGERGERGERGREGWG